MPKKYKPHVRRFVLDLVVKKGQSVKSVCEFTGISRTTIWRWRTIGVDDMPVKRACKKFCEAQTILTEALKKQPCMTYNDMRRALRENDVVICLRYLYTVLRRSRITRKRVKKKRSSVNCTPESKRQYRDTWNEVMNDGKDVLFQDESHFSQNILPTYGYSAAGTPCFVNVTAKRENHTLILAFSKYGELFYKVYPGAMNTARMQWFVDALPATRIVMDNLAIHKSVSTLGEKIFTPVAQPYANPVEIVFSKVKAAYRRINLAYPDKSVEAKIDEAIADLQLTDLANAIRHVHDYVNTNF